MKLLTTIVAICFAAGSANAAPGTVIKVYAGQSIQAAVDAANPGDTIEIQKGVFRENVLVTTGQLTLNGKGGIIDGEYRGPCITVHADRVNIVGLTLVNGTAGILAAPAFFAMPLAESAGPDVAPGGRANQLAVLKNTILAALPMGGVLIEGDDALLEGNTIDACGGFGIYYRALQPYSVTRMHKNEVTRTQFEFLSGGPTDALSMIVAGNGIDAAGGALELVQNRTLSNALAGIQVDVWGDGETKGKYSDPYFVRITQNRSDGNGGAPLLSLMSGTEGLSFDPTSIGKSGIRVRNQYGLTVLIEKNYTGNNAEDGVQLLGWWFDVFGNHAESNGDDGLDGAADDAYVFKNVLADNGDDGVRFSPPYPLMDGYASTPLYGNNIAGNTSIANGDEGFEIEGPYNRIAGNKANDNRQNGIQVWNGEYVTITGNTVTKNGHQGITNDAWMTDIVGNKVYGSACGLGPDIAGAGKGFGVVDAFHDNKFDTGGMLDTNRCDP